MLTMTPWHAIFILDHLPIRGQFYSILRLLAATFKSTHPQGCLSIFRRKKRLICVNNLINPDISELMMMLPPTMVNWLEVWQDCKYYQKIDIWAINIMLWQLFQIWRGCCIQHSTTMAWSLVIDKYFVCQVSTKELFSQQL